MPGEKCAAIVFKLKLKSLNLKVNMNDISTSHRLGRKPSTQRSYKRNILIELCPRDLKKDIMLACRNAKPNFFVNESLTPLRSTSLYVLRQAKTEQARLVECNSIGGRVFAWVKSQDGQGKRQVIVPVNTHLELESSCAISSGPLTEYMQRWLHWLFRQQEEGLNYKISVVLYNGVGYQASLCFLSMWQALFW